MNPDFESILISLVFDLAHEAPETKEQQPSCSVSTVHSCKTFALLVVAEDTHTDRAGAHNRTQDHTSVIK